MGVEGIEDGLVRVMARRLAFAAPGREACEWAEASLVVGVDSPALRTLAGMNLVGFPNEFEIDAQLRTCAVELGLDIPALTECLRRYARILAEDLLVGRVAPGDGRRALIRVFEKLGDFVAMSDWIGAEDALELARDGVHGTSEAAEERVRRQAATLVNGATGATSSRRDV